MVGEKQIPELTIDVENNHTEERLLSSICDSLEYVFLDTTATIILGRLSEISFSENYIIVYDEILHQIALFSRAGQFLSKISNRGKGPGEFIDVGAISINEDEDRIIISTHENRLICFNLQGEFISSIETEIPLHKFHDFGDCIAIITHFPSTFFYDQFSIHYIDFKGELLFRDVKRDLKEYVQTAKLGFRSYSILGDTLIFWESYFDSIYGLSKDHKVTPRWKINQGKNYASYDEHLNDRIRQFQSSGLPITTRIIETGNWFFIGVTASSRNYKSLVNKSNFHAVNISWLSWQESQEDGFINDIDELIPFWPKGSINEKTVYDYINPQKLKQRVKNRNISQFPISDSSKDLERKISSMSDLSNPILIIAHLSK